jgi:hypothetical protein
MGSRRRLPQDTARLHFRSASPWDRRQLLLINVAVWESVAHFKQAFMHPSFQAHLKDYPPSTAASPHLFAKVAVPNICVAG